MWHPYIYAGKAFIYTQIMLQEIVLKRKCVYVCVVCMHVCVQMTPREQARRQERLVTGKLLWGKLSAHSRPDPWGGEFQIDIQQTSEENSHAHPVGDSPSRHWYCTHR